MIRYKTEEEIEIMKEGGRRLRRVVEELRPSIKVGVTTKQIDNEAEKLILKMGAEPSFKKVKNYYWSTCLPVNEQIVHTPPRDRILKEGDIVTLDIGLYYRGFNTDYADSIALGEISPEKRTFLDVGKNTLFKAIKAAESGRFLGEVSQVIEEEIKKNEYHIVKELTGHGIGHELHEDPFIPGFVERPIKKTLMIRPGLTVAIEIIYAMHTGTMMYEKDDDWSIQTADNSLSACFEHTIAVTYEGKTIILT